MWLVLSPWIAWAQPRPTLGALEVTPGGFRASYDVTLAIAPDGTLSVDGRPAVDLAVPALVRERAAALGPDARLVVSADHGVPYARVVEVLDLVQSVGLPRVALEVGAAVPAVDPLSPIGREVENLDEHEYGDAFADYKPHRRDYPQNPYGSTDFTAYTRERGEWKLGVASVSYGILPRVHVGTSAVLDAFGIYNGLAKWNFARAGKVDLALAGSLYVVPITQLLRTFDADGQYEIAGQTVNEQDVFVDRITTSSLNLLTSVQVWKGWSLHGGVGWTRASAAGNLDFNDLPVVVVPGLEPIGGDLTLVPKVVGDLVDVRLATDLRFNRRDSLILQGAASVFAHARGEISGGIEGIPPELQDLEFAIGYGGTISPAASYRASIAWQFSWRKVDLRFGVGTAAIPNTWLLQAFDLSYRFGGVTRRTERKVKKAYREDRKEIDTIEEIDFAPPPVEPEGGG
jgi:hypothetical protein